MSDPAIWTQFGAIGVLAFVFYQLYVRSVAKNEQIVTEAKREAHEREQRMTARIQELESYLLHTLIPLVQDCNQALKDNTKAMNRFCDQKEEEETRRIEKGHP